MTISLDSINMLVFVKDVDCVVTEVKIELLYEVHNFDEFWSSQGQSLYCHIW